MDDQVSFGQRFDSVESEDIESRTALPNKLRHGFLIWGTWVVCKGYVISNASLGLNYPTINVAQIQ